MKKLSIYFLALAILFLIIQPAFAATGDIPTIKGFQIYQKDNIWNVPVNTLPVDPMSSTYISHENPTYFMWLGNIFPINIVDNSTPFQNLTSLDYPANYKIGPYQIPSNPVIEDSGGDHHMLIVNPDSNMLYELYQPVKAANGRWSAYGGQIYNLSDYALIPNGQWSTDVAGLPLTPGIIRYDELESGNINHSSRVAMYTTGDHYVWPARTGGNQASHDYPPTGQRFRLKASFNTNGYSPKAQTILNSWKTYGMTLADNSLDPQAWIISTDNDPRWELYPLWDEFANVHASDFEAVDTSSLMINKDSGQARIIPVVTPTPKPTPTITPTPTPSPTPTPTPTPTITPTPSPTQTIPTPTPTPSPSITVTSPNGGESWKRSTSQTIAWTYSGSPGSKVNIVLLKRGTNVGTIASSVPIGSSGKGSYIWKIPSNRQTGTDYKITIQSTTQSAVKDTSNNYFTIRS